MDDSRHGGTARNIDAILKLERKNKRNLTPLQRAFPGMASSRHRLLRVLPGGSVDHLDRPQHRSAHRGGRPTPYPFPLLSAFLAFEAVLLTSFVRAPDHLDQQSDRNRIDLQINMLADDRRALRLLRYRRNHSAQGTRGTSGFARAPPRT
jgi:hypothetical protein